jgi:hypothetical protein
MYELAADYKKQLDAISESIQGSEELTTYLDTEEDDDYKALIEAYEPKLAELHEEVIQNAPLQIIELERAMLAPEFEGLFIPRILGYSVLRGELNEEVKYVRPQRHFQSVLQTIIHSANFDMIKQRIGQSVQMGFALSSDIWVTNLLSDISNKRIKTYMENLVSTRFRDKEVRKGALKRYSKQFVNMHFLTSKFPANLGELKNGKNVLIRFLATRDANGLSHESYEKHLIDLIENNEMKTSLDFVEVLVEVMRMKHTSEAIREAVAKSLNELRSTMPRFNEEYFNLLKSRLQRTGEVDIDLDKAMLQVLDKSTDDDLYKFYALMDTIHGKGYIHDDTIDEVRQFYNGHEGLSTINESLRWTISGYFNKLMSNLEETDYPDYFELSKIFDIYMNLFSNEAFNQRVKQSNLSYIKRLLKHYTDKRGKEYQEIKKFVSTVFVDMGLFTEKEVVELFKTRRKRKKS